ncbi:hypothetical protein [Salinarimonas sp.]|uniref:hypothetical protein n=1 Tax=Salinarimonas sp. TaxID=2766526 RepID=UPI00391979AB
MLVYVPVALFALLLTALGATLSASPMLLLLAPFTVSLCVATAAVLIAWLAPRREAPESELCLDTLNTQLSAQLSEVARALARVAPEPVAVPAPVADQKPGEPRRRSA